MRTGSGVVSRSASASQSHDDRELGHVAAAQGRCLGLVGPEVQVRRFLLVGAKRDVVDVGLPGQRAVFGRHVGESVSRGVGQPGGQPDRPPAGWFEQRPRNLRDKRSRSHVDAVLDGRHGLRGQIDQPRTATGDQQRQIDALGVHAGTSRPFPRTGPLTVGVEGEQRDRHRGVEQRVPVDPPPGMGLGQPDGDPEDVGPVAGCRPVRIDVGTGGRRLDFQVPDGQARRAVVVVEEVGPEQSATGHAGRAAGARKLLAERPPGRHGKLRLGPPRRRRHPLGHPVDHDQLGRRRWCRRLGVHYGVGDVTCNPDGKECEVQE